MKLAVSLAFLFLPVAYAQTGVYPPPAGGGGGGTNYQTAEGNGTAQIQRPKFNIQNGSNITVTPSDNGSDTTTFTISGTGGGGGASQIGQLVDLAPGTPTSTAVAFGSACTSSLPCYVHVGGTRYPYTNTATVNITAGTASDTILFYIDSSGNRTLGYNSANTYTCPNCENSPVSGVSAFPSGSTPIWGCSVTSGAFTATSCSPGTGLIGDDRAIWSNTPVQGSLGISLIPSSGITNINLAEIPRIVTASSYTVVNGDCGNQLTFNYSGTVNVTLPAGDLGGQFVPGCVIEMRASSATAVTVNPQGGSTIAGASSLSIGAGQGQRLLADSSGNYQLGTGGQTSGSFLPSSGGTLTGEVTSNYTGSVSSPNILIAPSSTGNPYIELLQNGGVSADWLIDEGGNGQVGFYDKVAAATEFSIQKATGQIFATGSVSSGVDAVSYSATPVFNSASGNVHTITLTGNVTSSTISNLHTGTIFAFHICQDATGSRTFAFPSVFHGAMTIGATASKCSDQTFETPDGTNVYAVSPGVTNQ